MASFRFVTDLRIRAPADAVYEVLVHPEPWIRDWQDAVRVTRLHDGDVDGVGSAFDAVVRAPLGYRLSATITTVAATRPTALRMTSEGGLEGEARWRLTEDEEGVTEVTFDWDVRSTMAWLNALAPVARPLFERGHHVVIRRAAVAAAACLDAELLEVHSHARRDGRPG